MEERKGDRTGECTIVKRVVVVSVHGHLIEIMVVQGREVLGPQGHL